VASHRSKLLRITGIEQTFDYFCGPATAAMVLDFHHVPRPPTATWKADWQQALWLDVISHTAPSETPCTPADPTPCDGYMGFANQLCCNCGGGDCRCWSAAPQALKDTLNLHLATQKVAVQIVKDEDTSGATGREHR
jgi:hypothetical protein